MSQRCALTQPEKERIYWGKQQGQTLPELATAIGCSVGCARKWWRLGRDHGLVGLQAARRGRGQSGFLSQFDPRIAEAALRHKRVHPGWGADRVLLELRNEPALQGLSLPKRSRLAAFFKARCPECVSSPKSRPVLSPAPLPVTGVHEMWQLDSQEGIHLNDGQIATICNIRDPLGAAMIGSQAFAVKTEQHWRKLDWREVRQVLRSAFSEWQTLPDGLQTDNELGLAGGPNDPYPGLLTLWLVGLGVKHRFIRPACPTDQPQIERNHRTLDNLCFNETALTDLTHLQQTLDRERHLYNTQFPCRASDCARQPPLTAHPELLHPRRYYQPDLELVVFNIQRVYDYLATFTFTRTVSTVAQVSLGQQRYSLGQALMRQLHLQTVLARLDPLAQQWVFLTETDEELLRRPLKGLTVQTLTGLDPLTVHPVQPVQLTLPCFV